LPTQPIRIIEVSEQDLQVAVCIVTHNSADDLPGCLQSIADQSHHALEILVVDCASSDGSAEISRRLAPAGIPCRVVELQTNLGFTGGMNRAIQESSAPYVLTLNPDAQPTREYVARLIDRMTADSGYRVGAITGRLIRFGSDADQPLLDACGMRLTLTWRHLDRGADQPDSGQFSIPERVFGATGAATLFRREALDDVAFDGEIFATEFHTYREDAELCFRLRERCWEVLYEPTAECPHRRRNTPSRRRTMPARVNHDSLKNRYLLRAYHQDMANLLLTFIPTVFRDLLALGYVLTMERSSLPAYRWLWENRRSIRERRAALRRRRTCSSWELNRWFLRRGIPL
jgi:GT2 family glycosyltransferase